MQKDETLVLKVNDKEITFKSGEKEKKYTHTWKDDSIKEEDEKFEVSASVVTEKSTVKAKLAKAGNGTIIDDDKDPNDPETYDPLVIDLNNDGIKTIELNNTINFDLDSNGFKEATSWISENDAFIAIDRNNNGVIDNGSELFGNKTKSNTARIYTNPNSKNGFQALKEFDSNNDGIIDSNDEKFSDLLLWQDKNSDGISTSDEITKLSDKVTSINLILFLKFPCKFNLGQYLWY